jgi:DNA-binding XRE family transcriptional regulator
LETFAAKLKAWRGKLTQKEAASILGVSRRTYEAWEQGKTEPSAAPSMSEIEKRMKEMAK